MIVIELRSMLNKCLNLAARMYSIFADAFDITRNKDEISMLGMYTDIKLRRAPDCHWASPSRPTRN